MKFSDRSRYDTALRCLRKYFNQYRLFGGMGIVSTIINLPAVIGLATHKGIEIILQTEDIEHSVLAALAEFTQLVKDSPYDKSDIGLTSDPKAIEFKYLESRAIIEASVRTWFYVGLPRLLHDFDVIDVEKERLRKIPGTIRNKYGIEFPDDDIEGVSFGGKYYDRKDIEEFTLHMFRCDALLKHRLTNDVYVFNFKTSRSWDRRKNEYHRYNVQGLSDIWGLLEEITGYRVMGSLYHYIKIGDYQKGKKLQQAELDEGLTENEYPQAFEYPWMKNMLVHPYAREVGGITEWDRSFHVTDKLLQPACTEPHPWSGKGTVKIDGVSHCPGGKRHYVPSKEEYSTCNIWEVPGGVKEWVDLLATREDQPLEKMLVTPETYVRNDRMISHWIKQYSHWANIQSTNEAVLESRMQAGGMDLEWLETYLDEHYPQNLNSCTYPTLCEFIPMCHGNLQDPLENGFKLRVPNHEAERVSFEV